MGFRIEERFAVKAPAEAVWAYVTDPRRVVSCLPGAELTEVVDPRTFNGAVKVKVGPVTVSYRGRVQLIELDEGARRVLEGLDFLPPLEVDFGAYPESERSLEASLRKADCYFFTGQYDRSGELYAALKGNGQTARYVTLPLESHGYKQAIAIGDTIGRVERSRILLGPGKAIRGAQDRGVSRGIVTIPKSDCQIATIAIGNVV